MEKKNIRVNYDNNIEKYIKEKKIKVTKLVQNLLNDFSKFKNQKILKNFSNNIKTDEHLCLYNLLSSINYLYEITLIELEKIFSKEELKKIKEIVAINSWLKENPYGIKEIKNIILLKIEEEKLKEKIKKLSPFEIWTLINSL